MENSVLDFLLAPLKMWLFGFKWFCVMFLGAMLLGASLAVLIPSLRWRIALSILLPLFVFWSGCVICLHYGFGLEPFFKAN